MKNKFILSTFAITIATSIILAPVQTGAETMSFTDVPASHTMHTEIMDLVGRGVINGFSDGTFRPDKEVNRAEFAAFVARSLDLPSATSNFKDVPKSAALYDGVSRAYSAGIIKGFSNGSFKPSTSVNRQDMAVMLDRALQIKGSFTKTKALDFSDKARVGAYAKVSVERLYYYNIMGAYTGNNFASETIGTRAETVLAIYNMLQVKEGIELEPQPPTDGDNPVRGDVVYLKGIKFESDSELDGMWLDEYGFSYYGLPKADTEFSIKDGLKYSYRTNYDKQSEGSSLVFYLITMGLDFTKTEFLGIINQVSATGKPVVAKGIKFYLNDPKDKSKIVFTLN